MKDMWIKGCIISVFLSAGLLVADPLLKVGASVPPMEKVISELGDGLVEVRSLQQEGDSCSVFEPRPSSIAWLSEARLFFRTGAGYESAIVPKLKRQFPDLTVLDLRDALEETELPEGGQEHDHRHGHEHGLDAHRGHDHGHASDPHLWLDPINLLLMGDWIHEQLAAYRPQSASLLEARHIEFRERCRDLHAFIESLLGPYKGRAFFIYHPSLGHFADRYGLEQIPIEGGGKAPSAFQLQNLINRARAVGITTIFVQPQESRHHAEIVAEAIGARLVEINPMERDWESSLKQITLAMVAAFERESPDSSG